MSKKILGLDLGTTSIGWAFVREAEKEDETSSIEKIGVRIVHYGDNLVKVDKNGKITASLKPEEDFQSGKGLSPNAGRTMQRGMRRNLQRYKQRRKNLIDALITNKIIDADTVLAEDEKQSTHATYALRAKAATQEVSLHSFARVLLMINKKRGYKSSRKAKNEDEGQIIDGMAIAMRLYEEDITPGQLSYLLLREGKKNLPDFYRSDLQAELEKVWEFQQQFYPEIFTEDLKKEVAGKGKKVTAAIFWSRYGFNTAENKGTFDERKLQAYKWRSDAVKRQLSKEEATFVFAEINNNLSNSSGYLGAISDRSKELYFNKETVGQFLYRQLAANPHTRIKGQVFYRQDYFDEFEIIWETQSKYHKELTQGLKAEIRDIIIFYQRKLKSQKNLVSFCEFESREVEIKKDGKTTTKIIGAKVAPKSSPLFQEFKIWQILQNLEAKNKSSKEIHHFDEDAKQTLFEELNVRGNLTKDSVLTALGYKPKDWELNFSDIDGNRTAHALYEAFMKMMVLEGHEEIEWEAMPAQQIKVMVRAFFESAGINSEVLEFNAELDGKAFEKQASYRLWHLLYSYEEDASTSGNEHLYQLLKEQFGFKKEFAQILANIYFQQDYGSLSAKAMRKIFPFIRQAKYETAKLQAGYKSASLTKEENENRILKDRLDILPKNSLRNPIVEKILNQMVNVVNAIILDPELGRPDEIRIELARELKMNAKEREEMTKQITEAKSRHDEIRKILIAEDGIKNPTRNDIIRYKLYEELKLNGYKTLYSNTYIPREKLFSKEFDIEHIIPRARFFDDSFSNKTLCVRQENLDKKDSCAADFIGPYFGEEKLSDYLARVERMYKTKEGGITKAKYKKLLMKADEIGKGFIERDLRDTQYIAKKAKQMLHEICRNVLPTTGSVTDRLRDDWGLINILQELNLDKYRKLGLTEMIEKKDGGLKERITDWTKRNDHRHHAMDALTVAFTKHNHIQYLNNLNARSDKAGSIYGIEQKETVVMGENGSRKRKFKAPMPHFREAAKKHLEEVLISFKSKSKVVTKNKNTFKTKAGEKSKIELTPRGQLHMQTVYGKIQQYATKEEKVGAKFDEQTISKVANYRERNALLQRLQENNNDPKKAFTGKNSLEKSPVYLDIERRIKVPEKVKLVWQDAEYTIRKDVTPDLKIDKVIDAGLRKILQSRLDAYKGNAKEAFSNLDKNPIWQNEAKGIAIKRVAISGVRSVEALHTKKDHLGKGVLDELGNNIPVDFVNTGNNHHVAIYRDANGDLQEKIVSFFEAVGRVNQSMPVIDKEYNSALGWNFLFTMKQNEYFVFPGEDFNPREIDFLNPANNKRISKNLFRVQKIATKNYFFRHHLETTVEERKELKDIAYKPQLGLAGIKDIVKVRINHLGKIVKVGEY